MIGQLNQTYMRGCRQDGIPISIGSLPCRWSFSCYGDEENEHRACTSGHLTTANQPVKQCFTAISARLSKPKHHIESLICIKGRGYKYCSISDFQKSSIGTLSLVHPFSGVWSGTYCEQWYPLLFRSRRKGKQYVF